MAHNENLANLVRTIILLTQHNVEEKISKDLLHARIYDRKEIPIKKSNFLYNRQPG